MIAACRRHLRDLETGHLRGLRWDVEKAQHAINFFPSVLTITDGAAAGKPFKLLGWQVFVVGSLFGWKTQSGRMRWRSAWLETGKGQAKSPLMAAIGIYMMGYYSVARAHVYAIGQDKATANVVFKDAAAMCRAPIPQTDPEELDTLESRGEVILRGFLDNAFKIEHPDSNSVFQAIANGESISGPRPNLVIADEIHEFKTGTPIETWKRAVAKMNGDAMMLMGTNTPATTQIIGDQYSNLYQKIVKGIIPDDSAFAFIARVDVADREHVFENESCWIKSLPALGITFPIDNIRVEVASARALISTAMSVKRLYFGIPTGTVDFWISEPSWAAVQGKVDPDQHRGKKCWLALDLSQKNDLTSLTACWEVNANHLSTVTWYWTTKEGLEERSTLSNAPFDVWAEDPTVNLTAVPGSVIDKTFVAVQVKEICSAHEVQFLAFDPAHMADFIKACDDIGFPVWKYEGPDKPEGIGLKLVNHGQGPRIFFEEKQLCMPKSIERFEDRILEKKITIHSCPVTYMCAANALVVADGQNNRAFDKRKSRGKIDGLVTNAMAVGAATMTDNNDLDDWLKSAVKAATGAN